MGKFPSNRYLRVSLYASRVSVNVTLLATVVTLDGRKQEEYQGGFFITENYTVDNVFMWCGRFVLAEHQIPHMPGTDTNGGYSTIRWRGRLWLWVRGSISYAGACTIPSGIWISWICSRQTILHPSPRRNRTMNGTRDKLRNSWGSTTMGSIVLRLETGGAGKF